ncbi:MAG: Gfo/Idh/MocA family oxidoreductase [Myxococcales bacterium]|nr:Gfo/Idh/MocA family oxidoreductase [Myxococcales bacterium]
MSTPSSQPSSPDLKIAIAGSGLMAVRHAAAISRAAVGARLIAFADPDLRAQEAFQQAYPEAKPYSSLTALLESESIDAVHICTPPSTHERLAIEALEAGCHIYVEKPFAETLAGAQRVVELAQSRGRSVCAGHQLLFEAPARRAAELLPALGEIVHIESYFTFRPVRTGTGGRKPLRLDLQLLDVLPHPVYSLLYFLEAASAEGETRIVACELGPKGTAHVLLRRGGLSASLVISLEGRPVESYLKIVGQNGLLYADFVRGTVQHLIGPGTSMIDKMLNPYRQACQLVFGTTRSLFLRLARRQMSYPGLAEIFEAFYRSIHSTGNSPVSADNILSTVAVCEQVAAALQQSAPAAGQRPDSNARQVLVTGGTGFLGQELVRALVARKLGVRVLARREPATWHRIEGVEYVVGDLGEKIPEEAVAGIETVVHLAAETAGGFEEHRRNSIDATERVIRAAAKAGVKRVIHVSSLAVHEAAASGSAIREDTALETNARERGPYVWGKVESEQLANRLATELGIEVKIARPGAIIDRRAFEPPGRLGKRIGNVFVAVGAPSDRLGIVDRDFAARALAWTIDHFEAAPGAINLLSPTLPQKRTLIAELKRANPGIWVFWLPRPVLAVISRCAVLAQRVLRRDRVPVDLEKIFAVDSYDTTIVRKLAEQMRESKADPAVGKAS